MTALREDLLHLTPEALSHAANAGIVKRAVRELAGGYTPRLTLAADGLLDANFDDGVSLQWPPGVTLQQVRCSCGASGVCRHRIVVALAYRASAQQAAQPPAEAAPVATVSDEALARVIAAPLLAQAQALRDAGLSVELRRRASGEPCETARLPSATVRYWGGAALEAARCDCLRASACEHVALGAWAFRLGEQQDATAAQLTVRLGGQGGQAGQAGQGAAQGVDPAPFEPLVEALLHHGVWQGNAALLQGLSSARAAAADAAWLAGLMADLETWSEGYARRSALYDATQGVDLLAELALRLAAGRLPGNAGAVLGLGQASETALDRLRLMCLGARTRRDGEARRTTLVMADIDTGTRLMLTHAWQVPEARQTDEAAIRGAERLAPGVRLEALARGQLLAQQAARRPDGSLRLAGARSSQNSVLPQSGDWGQLGVPVRFDRVQALRAEQQAHPVAAFQPRHGARRFIVFSPAAVEAPAYDAHDQRLVAVLRDADGGALLLQRAHERHVPHALDALAAGLSSQTVQHVAGMLAWHHGTPVIEPWALAGEGQVVVPDFGTPAGALAQVPLGAPGLDDTDPCSALLHALREHLGALMHHGLSRLPRDWAAEGTLLARRLEDAGLRVLGQALRAWLPAVAQAQAQPRGAALAPPFLTLLALRQLHADAATMGAGADTDSPDRPVADPASAR